MSTQAPKAGKEKMDRVFDVITKAASLQVSHEIMVQLEKSKHATDQLIYHLPELIFIIDDRGRILKGNHAAEDMLNARPGELIAQPLAQVFSNDNWQQFWSKATRLHSVADTSTIVEFDLASDGNKVLNRCYHWIIRLVNGLSDRRGKLFFVVGHDITEIKMMLNQIQESHRALEAHSQKLENLLATVQKQKAQIVETSKLAQLGEMAGGIAHEINNPITIIKGHAEHIQHLVQQKPINAFHLVRSAGVITATVDRIAAIVKSMRSLARDGASDPFERIDIVGIINEALVFFREKFRSRAITLKLDYKNEPLYVDCRAVQISQVFINLLNNARDAICQKEEQWVELTIKNLKSRVIIKITDSGDGIPKDIADKIMQPFYTTKPVGSGTGLGLSIARSIIQDHGGLFYLDEENPHTSFVINLPKSKD